MRSSEAAGQCNAEQNTFLNKNETMDGLHTNETKVDIENRAKKGHIYGVNDSPPLSVTIICGLQVRIYTHGNKLRSSYVNTRVDFILHYIKKFSINRKF